MTTFVLVHGAWHYGSCWEIVTKSLESLGHRVFTPTVAGHGRDVSKNVDHAEMTDSVVDYLLENELTDIVLVGHSLGGTVISKVAEYVLDRIRRLVFYSAFVLEDGQSVRENFPRATGHSWTNSSPNRLTSR